MIRVKRCVIQFPVRTRDQLEAAAGEGKGHGCQEHRLVDETRTKGGWVVCKVTGNTDVTVTGWGVESGEGKVSYLL